MADGVNITAGSGVVIASDDIAGVQYQRVKVTHGADGSATDVSTASPMPVTLANTGANATPVVVDLGANNDVTVTGTVAVTDNSGSLTVDNSTLSVVGGGTEATAMRVTIASDSTGVVSIDDNGGSLTVDGTVGISGTVTVASHAVTNAGTFAVQSTNQANSGVDIGDVTINNASGASAVNIQDGGNSITVDGTVGVSGTVATSMATNTPVGNVAHDAADSGAPIKVGGRARSSEITAVANDDRTDFVTDLASKQIIMPYSNNENFVSGAITTAMTGTTSTSLVAAPAAGLRNYITTIIVSNSHATVGTDVIIQDGSGGTTLMTIPAAALYGGAVINLPVPLRQPTTATALYCANVTTGASTKVSCVGYKGY